MYIDNYLLEFHEKPLEIEEYKINTLKNFYYDKIYNIFPIARENFQIGVNKNFNLLFFRDKKNKHNELVLNIYTNTSIFNFRKQISYSFKEVSFDNLSSNLLINKQNINNSLDNLNKKKCNIFNCSIFNCSIV